MKQFHFRGATLAVAGISLMIVAAACGSPDVSIKATVTRIAAANAPATRDPNQPTSTAAPTEKSAPTTAPSTSATEPAADSAQLIQKGEQLFNQFACVGCHSVSGQPMIGPALNGLPGTTVQLMDGSTIPVDAAYLRESILDPDAKIVDGFSPGMMAAAISAYQSELSREENISAVVAYIESLK